ncbi:ChaN family lipoprotein [Pedobacter sp. AW31-3R]|uniref:ChaN family lipoprotein n=1 Tax=Pedobacter sp. AW31-3R TaxID=3445781 RepID=UPI003FA03D59
MKSVNLNMNKFRLLLSCILSPMVLMAQNPDLPYKIYEVKSKKTIAIPELVKALENTDVFFFGEEHNDSIGHLLEVEIFEQAVKAYPGTAISMEMFSTDVQPVINEYLDGLISEKNFVKEARAWNNYKDYRPLIEFAKTNKVDVIAANAATRYSNAVTMKGLEILQQFPAASKSFLPPLPIDTAEGRYYEKFNETLGGHTMGNMKIYQTQNLWDATMSWSIASYIKSHRKAKVFHLNGRFHSDEKLGIAGQLKKHAAKLNITTISCFPSADFDQPDWQKHGHLADYIIISKPLDK